MSQQLIRTVLSAIKTHLKTNFAPARQRVHTVTTKTQYIFTRNYKTPGIAIVYRGGPLQPQKGGGSLYTINVEVFAFQTIWKEGEVVDNESTEPAKMGLLQMQDEIMNLLESNLLTTEMPGGQEITNATVTDLLGTEDYPEIGSENYSGCIGIRVQYKVLTT
jgi:hypothetical protein